MKLELFRWDNATVEVDIGDLEDIAKILMEVLSGDEVLHVWRKDTKGSKIIYDSCDNRTYDFHDDLYTVFDAGELRVNLFENPKFMNRTHSMWRIVEE